MKSTQFILKCLAIGLAVAAVVCAVVAYWDKIMDLFYSISEKLEARKVSHISVNDEFTDFVDGEA